MSRVRQAAKTKYMRKCRNWQTSKTKDLVIIAIVWVQVPSSALNNKTGTKQNVWSLSCCSKPKRALNPWFKVSPPARSVLNACLWHAGLRSASLCPKPGSTGVLHRQIFQFDRTLSMLPGICGNGIRHIIL